MKKILKLSLMTLFMLMTSVNLSANDDLRNATNTTTEIQQIRNATIKVTYGDTVFLIDPMFAEKGFYEGFEGSYRSYLRNPLVDLPIKIEEVLSDVDAVIVTHTHLDHWDDAAQKAIPKNIPLFVQNESDKKLIESQGFHDVRVLSETVFQNVKLTKTGGQHGTDEMYSIQEVRDALGEAMGIVFEEQGHPTIYVAGDTIWRPEVDETIETFNPSVIVLNIGNALLDGFEESIIMGKEDAYRATQKSPNAKIVATHLDAINHMSLTREDLAEYVKEKKIEEQVIIPLDGEVVSFE